MDNGQVMPVEKDGTAYVPVKAVVEAFGGTVTESTAVLGEKTLALDEGGLLPVSAFAEFGFFAKYYPDAPYAEGVIVISNEGFYTADAAAADAINPVTIHAVALLLSRVRETREYVSIELPKAFYELANPGPDKGISEKMLSQLANAGMNEDLYPIPEEAVKKEGVPAGKVTKLAMEDCKTYPGVAHDIWTYIPAQYDGVTPLNLVIFTDGQNFFEVNGVRGLSFDMPTVLDNMIHEGQIPPTAALFVATALMACASVAMMRMAGLYQFALRNQPKKDIQVVLMGGENDHTGTRWGNWPTVTRMVGDALDYSGYSYLYFITKGAHAMEWPARLLPKTLRCVWMGEDFHCDHVEIVSRNGL